MPARLSRHVLVTGAATCALVLGAATPVIARPGPHPPPQGGYNARADASIQTSSLAGTTEWNVGPASSPSPSRAAQISAPDDGATTLAVVLIAGGALAAGAGAGFAGGRRVALRLH